MLGDLLDAADVALCLATRKPESQRVVHGPDPQGDKGDDNKPDISIEIAPPSSADS